jgi:hypothetical protein
LGGEGGDGGAATADPVKAKAEATIVEKCILFGVLRQNLLAVEQIFDLCENHI